MTMEKIPSRLARVEIQRDEFRLLWRDDSRPPLTASWLWLRDHDPSGFHPQTRQRLTDTFSLPSSAPPTAEIRDGGGTLQIGWEDGRISKFSADFFAAMDSKSNAESSSNLLWDAAAISAESPTMDYADITADESGTRLWLEKVARYGFCLVQNAPPNSAATEKLARAVGYIRETIFGGLWQFTANLAHADTAYTKEELGLHTDGTYSLDPPGCQILHCLEFDGTGGDSVFADGFCIGEMLRSESPALFDLLCDAEIPAQYIDEERGIFLRARHPVFRLDSGGEIQQICFNNHDRAPFLLDAKKMPLFYQALAEFHRLANSAEMQWRKRLAPGEAILFDNWRVLHGRSAYEGRRTIAGAYINREDFQSRLRVLRAA